MIYFKKFFVKPIDEENWEKDEYNVLALDVNKELVPTEPVEQPETKEDKLFKDEDDEDEQERSVEYMEQDMDQEEHITMLVLLGNEQTGELQWFDINDVKYISSV